MKSKCTYPNLESLMKAKRIRKSDISKLLGVRYATTIDKFMGRSKFSYDEALRIKTHFFPEHELEYIFQAIEMSEREIG